MSRQLPRFTPNATKGNQAMRTILLALALTLAASSAFAQASVNQAPNRADAATFMASTPAPATACATVNTTVANNTVTITPPAGQYVYITGVYADITSDATGATQVAVAGWTNISNPNGTAPNYSLASLILSATGAQGAFRQIMETYNPPLKSAVAGTAVTLVPSAQLAHSIYCPRVAGYFAK